MEKIINKLINHVIKGVDTYTHNGSTWLIFTESKQWVIELTESKTLWYNYNFFKNAFVYVSMDVVENQHYITKWVEDNVINKVKDTILEKNITEGEVEEIIENGVKEHSLTYVGKQIGCEDTIKNGVKHTEKSLQIDGSCVIEDTVQNGVKVTQFNDNENKSWVEGVIKGGVKVTLNTEYMPTSMVEDIIQSGVKETSLKRGTRPFMVNETLKNGVKETKGHGFEQQNIIDDIVKDGVKEIKTPNKDGDIVPFAEWMKENNSSSYTKMIDDVIDNGIKETQPLPDQSGELIGYGNYYHGKEDRTKAFYNYLEDTIKFGVKET